MGPAASTLSQAFLSAHGGASTPDVELEAALEEALQKARASHPTLPVDRLAFVHYLAARLEDAQGSWAAAVLACRSDELYLVHRCIERDAAAMAVFERDYLAKSRSHISRIQGDDAFVTEVLQQLREKLFLGGPDGRPKLLDYTARGPLGGWLRAAAVRTALNLREKDGRSSDHEIEDWMVAGPGEPELAILRTRFKADFAKAFEAAFEGLTAQERNLLRLHLLDGVSVDRLAKLFQTHRATVYRWIIKARESVAEGTLKHVSERLRMSASETEELMALMTSQLDLSLERLLRVTHA